MKNAILKILLNENNFNLNKLNRIYCKLILNQRKHINEFDI